MITESAESPGERVVVRHNVAPLRAFPTGQSEQTSQYVLGELLNAQRAEAGYLFVRGADGYEGWISEQQTLPLYSAPEPWRCADLSLYRRVSTPFAPLCDKSGAMITRLPMGAALRAMAEPAGGFVRVVLPDGALGLIASTSLAEWLSSPLPPRAACAAALACLGTPYLWGGSTPFGFDCSGLTQRCFQLVGRTLPRDAYQQAEQRQGIRLDAGSKLEPGDLIFFRGKEYRGARSISHVGIMIDADRMVHAHGTRGVGIDTIASPIIAEAYDYCGAWRAA